MTNDPDGAVTAAKSLLESVCKHVLDEAGESYGNNDDLPQLYSRAAKHLSISASAQVDDTIRKRVGAAQQVVERVGALRNLVGDAHGKGHCSPTIEVRDAELAVNLSGSLSAYITASWEAK